MRDLEKDGGLPANAGRMDFTHTIRVRWADCDPARIAFTGRIPGFALEAIEAWWEHRVGQDWYRLNFDRDLGTPFVHLSVDFRAPVTPRHLLDCQVRLIGLGTSSITFRVDGHQDGRLCFTGKFVSVFIEARAFQKIPAPPEIRELVAPFLSPED